MATVASRVDNRRIETENFKKHIDGELVETIRGIVSFPGSGASTAASIPPKNGRWIAKGDGDDEDKGKNGKHKGNKCIVVINGFAPFTEESSRAP